MAENSRSKDDGQSGKDKKLPPCNVNFVYENETHQGTSIHFDEVGMFVLCAQPAPLNTKLTLLLDFSFIKKPIEVQGEVVWTNVYGPDEPLSPRGMGVKFHNLDGDKSRMMGELSSRYKDRENYYRCYYT